MKKISENARIRHEEILNLLTRNGRVSVDEFALDLKTTPQTIRKDLSALEEQNRVVRFHGGASLLAGIEYTDFEARKNIASAQKESIARICSEQIPNNAAVIINSGTTTHAVARRLRFHSGLRIVTDSVVIANDIRDYSGIEVIVPGGRVRASDGAIVGHAAVDFIQQFRPDVAVIGAAAIGRDGALLDYDMSEVAVARKIIEIARHVILAVDSTKFDRMAPVKISELSNINTLVTDDDCPEGLRSLCRESGVQLLEAR